MKYRCKSRVLYISSLKEICPFTPCEVELKENPSPPIKGYKSFVPRGCLYGAFYQEWEEIKDEKENKRSS